MTTATQTEVIDTSLTKGEYQPLAPWSPPEEPRGVPTAEWLAESRAASDASRSVICPMLSAAGYIESDGDWWSRTCQVRIVGDREAGTMGVEIYRTSAAARRWHMASGTYDALPLAEKFRISGADGGSTVESWTVEAWLASFDRHGLARPGDGCR